LSPSAGGLNGGVSLAGKLLDHIIRKRPVMTAKRLDVRPVLAVKTKLKAFTADETLIQLGYHFGPNASLGFSLHFFPFRLRLIFGLIRADAPGGPFGLKLFGRIGLEIFGRTSRANVYVPVEADISCVPVMRLMAAHLPAPWAPANEKIPIPAWRPAQFIEWSSLHISLPFRFQTCARHWPFSSWSTMISNRVLPAAALCSTASHAFCAAASAVGAV
jgi:hypothetical protein